MLRLGRFSQNMEHLFRNKLAPAEVFSVATVRVWEGGGMVGNKDEGGISQGAATSSSWSLWPLKINKHFEPVHVCSRFFLKDTQAVR